MYNIENITFFDSVKSEYLWRPGDVFVRIITVKLFTVNITDLCFCFLLKIKSTQYYTAPYYTRNSVSVR